MLHEFVHQIKETVKEELLAMHTAMPAKIVDLNATTGFATVQPLVKRPIGKSQKIDYPKINGVPIVFPQGNGQKESITFPAKPGDLCLLIISEQSLENWLYDRETDTDLRFDLTNAICIPGLFQNPPASFAESCEKDSVIISSGKNRISVGSDEIEVTGNFKVSGDINAVGSITPYSEMLTVINQRVSQLEQQKELMEQEIAELRAIVDAGSDSE